MANVPRRAMRRLGIKRSFRVEIAPAVWRDLGQVPSDAFKRMQAELENIAELSSVCVAADRPTGENPRGTLHRLQVDAFEGIYEVDPERAVVRLVSVHRNRGRTSSQ